MSEGLAAPDLIALDLIALGVVARPHGVRGELRVHPYNPESTLLLTEPLLWLRERGGLTREATVEHARPGPKGAVLLTLVEVVDREEAERLRGAELCVPRAHLPKLAEGEWYQADLVGLRAVSAAGDVLGEVVEVVEYPTVCCLRVRCEDGDREVPLVEPWVGEVDVEGGRVVVTGLADLPMVPKRRR